MKNKLNTNVIPMFSWNSPVYFDGPLGWRVIGMRNWTKQEIENQPMRKNFSLRNWEENFATEEEALNYIKLCEFVKCS